MSTTHTQQHHARSGRFNPLAIWRRLPVNAKLLIPVALAFVALVAIFAFLLPPLFDGFVTEATQVGFNTHIDGVNVRVLEFFDDTSTVMRNLVTSDDVLSYGRAVSTGNTAAVGPYVVPLRLALTSNLNNDDVTFTSLRFLNTAGEQAIVVESLDVAGTSSRSLTRTELISESGRPYFRALVGLEPGQVYYSSLTMRRSYAATATDSGQNVLSLEIGSPVYDDDVLLGYVIGSLSPVTYLGENLKPGAYAAFNFQTVLVDTNGTPFMVADRLAEPQVQVLGERGFEHPVLPEEVLSGGEQSLLTVGFRTYSTLLYDTLSRDGLINTGWRMVVSKSVDEQPISNINDVINLATTRSLLVLLGALVFIAFVAQSVVRPLSRLSAGARQIAQGDLSTRVKIRTGGEIGELASAMNSMTERLDDLVSTLESRVAERTRNIQLAADISRQAAQLRNIDELLQFSVDTIRERFKLYHVQIFFVDDAGKYAVLVVSTGEAGREMLARKHKLAVGSPSIVGQVTDKRRTFVTMDTQQSEVPHRFNPILPLTRSEMALPLQVAGTLIGALDIQSVEPDAFSEDDVQIFQVLADQLAISIDNARLLYDQQQRVDQIDGLNRMLTRATWEEFLDERSGVAMGYQYDLQQIAPNTADADTPATKNGGIEAPIRVRGETVGNLSVAGSTESPLSGEERAIVQAVAERVALAVENIRLVEQTQSALSRVEQLYDTSRALGASVTVDDVYQLTAERLSRYAVVDYVVVLVAGPDPTPQAPYFDLQHLWSRNTDQQFQVAGSLRSTREQWPPTWVSGDTRDPHIAEMPSEVVGFHELRTSLGMLRVRSAMTIPLATQNRWFGSMLLLSRQPRSFNLAFAQFVSALADQVAIALENRYLFQQAQTEASRNRALAEAAQAASQISGDVETGVRSLIETVAVAAGFDRWWFGLLQLAGRRVHLERTAAEAPDASPLVALDDIALDDSTMSLAQAARTGSVVLVNNPASDALTCDLSPDMQQGLGKHVAIPVRTGNNTAGALLVGRPADGHDLNDSDIQLALTVASQISIALENRRLFNVAQTERETLQTVLNSLPTGVVVADAATGNVTLSNEQARELLGLDKSNTTTLVHTGTDTPLEDDELPVFRVLRTQEPIYAQDVSAVQPDGTRVDMLINAVPVFRDGQLISAVAVFQDVTQLRQLESVLQESLRETTILYEITRSIAAEHELISILSAMALQLYQLYEPDHLFAVFSDSSGRPVQSYALHVGDQGITPEAMEEATPVPPVLLNPHEPLIESDVRSRPDLADDPRLESLRIASVTVLPLSARSHAVGWLVMGFTTRRTLSSDEQRMLAAVADQTAIAAEGVRLAEETAQALETTTRLYDANLNISRAESIEGVISGVRDQLKFFNPSQIDIYMFGTQGSARIAERVVAWDAHDPDGDDVVRLSEGQTFDNWAFLESDALYVENVSTTDRHLTAVLRTLPSWGQFAAHASVPLAVKGRVIGRLAISFARPHIFDLAEQQILTTLADQASIAIDNFMLVQQTQETLDETAVLYQTSRAISNADDMTEQLAAIIDYAVQPIVTGALLIRLLSQEWTGADASIEIAASWHRMDEDGAMDLTGIRFTPDQFPAWREVSSSEVVWIDDMSLITQPSATDETIYRLMGFRSVLVFPLTSASRPVGALLFGSSQPWPYSDREVRVYTSLADLVAISMERQRLLEQTDRRARQLQLSAQIAQSATSILNLDELFDRTVNLIRDSFNYDHVQVFRISPDGRDARVVAATGEAGKQLIAVGHHLRVGSRSVIGQVTGNGKAQIVADTAAQGSVHRPNPYLPRTRAEMALPLVARNRILGALDVQSNEPGAFTEDDVAVLSTLADQIAIAIDNASLFETSSQRAEEMRFLFDVTRAATGIVDDTEPAVRRVATLILDNLGASSAALLLLDDTQSRLIPYWVAVPDLQLTPPDHYDFSGPYLKSFATAHEPLIVNDVPAAMLLAQTTSRLGQGRLIQHLQGILPDAGSALLVPLASGENFLGILCVAKLTMNGFTDDSIRLVQTLSSSLAAVLQNARLLREVQTANTRLLELDRLKNQFLANMSHELRTPLNSIIGFSRVILKGIDGPLTEMQEQDLTTIYDSGKHLLGLVNDILDQAKIEADKMEFASAYFSMVDLVKGVMSTAVGLVKDKPIKLHQELEEDLPPVWGDEFRTRQALLNLVSNAAKFTQQGSITASAFRIERDGRQFVQVSITDTGIGVPEDKLEAIFEPFQQAENSPARQYEGTGLGLPIARKLIKRQGGTIWVVSELGVGSTFSMIMPCEPSPESANAAEEDSEAEAQAETAESGDK